MSALSQVPSRVLEIELLQRSIHEKEAQIHALAQSLDGARAKQTRRVAALLHLCELHTEEAA